MMANDEADDDDDHVLDNENDSNDECEAIEENLSGSESEVEASDSDESADSTVLEKDFFIGKGAIAMLNKSKGKKSASSKNRDQFSDIDDSLKWKKTPYAKPSKTKSKNIVDFRPGPSPTATDISDECGAFFKMIDDDMLEEIITCTNLRISTAKSDYVRDRDCKEMSKSELLALIGILFLIGTRHGHHANVRELWESDGTGMMLLRANMSYTRFNFLLCYLRFDDSSTRAARKATDKLAPIRLILDQFIENCKKHYIMGECMTIDEMLHPFRGRCSFIQYIPSKPAKYGLKIFACCDSDTFYTGNFEVYCGKQPEGPYKKSNCPSDIVKRLVQPYENKNRNLTTDNWYTSHDLGQDLLNKKITLLGTMRKNKREIPQEFLPSKQSEPGSSTFGFQPNMTLVSYVPKPKKAVILLSTMHDQPKIDPETQKPEMIIDYNETKGGVDTVDKMCAFYSVSRITRRWPLALFYVILNISGINAQILYFSVKSENVRRRIFLKNLSLALMKPLLMERVIMPKLPNDIKAFLQKFCPAIENEKETAATPKRGRCVSCKNSSTTIKCSVCFSYTCKKHSSTIVTCQKCSLRHRSDSDSSD